MPILVWITAVVGFLGFIASIIWIVWAIRRDSSHFDFTPKGVTIGLAVVAILVAIVMAVGPIYWLYGTAPGQRELKSFASETGGGLDRTVEVYDLQGDLIKTYKGKFDIQEDSTKVFFDLPQESGDSKRVQIYNATVIVEEE